MEAMTIKEGGLPLKRILLGLSALLLSTCNSRVPSVDAEFRDIQSLLSHEQYDLAMPKAEQCLTRAEHRRNATELWRFRLLKAEIQIGQRLAARTLALLDEYGEPPAGAEWGETRARLLLLRGRASYTLSQLSAAEDFLSRAAVAARKAGSESLSNEVLLRQGALFVRQRQFDKARRAFQTVAATAARLHDTYEEASALGNMGYDLLSESRHDEAIPWFERAITLFTNLGAGDSVARTHGNLGVCFFRLGDYDSARAHYQKADEWFAKTGNRDSQQIWIGNAGNVAYEMGDYTTAEAAYKRALEVARQVPSPVWVARWLDNLSVVSLELGKWDAAEAYNTEALAKTRELKDASWEPTALVHAGRIEEGRGNLGRARDLFREALSKHAEDPSVPLDAHSGMARTYLAEGRTQQAEAEFQSTVAMIEQRGAQLPKDEYKLFYLSSLIQFYRKYVDFLVVNGQQEKALEVAESSRSRVLAEKLGGRAAVERHSAREYRQLARQTQSVLLEYWLTPGKSYLWTITPEAIQLHELPPAATIRPLIESYRAVIAGGRNPLEVANDTGQKLYATLLGPAQAGSRFIVVPDGDLHSFPLEALPTPADPRRYWIDQATVAIAPSLSYLASQARQRSDRSARDLLVIGEPSSSSQQYPRLEFAGQEIDSIASAMHAAQPDILRGDKATPDSYTRAKPGHYGFIHLAAHATVNPRSPLDSAVILSGPADQNRLLARHVMAVPLSAQLVTISACRSAGGKSYAGEGLVGFAWAFLRAGARNVIAGLWDVSDRSTAQLMSGLYRGIANGEDTAAALRDAKLTLIRSGGAYSKPYYWAPFQLYVGSMN
jgi:CHAT domain-containing protein/Tfp pilus assembly protein PilF